MKRLFLFSIINLFSIGNSICQTPNYLPTDSLKSWWPFTGNAVDSSGNGNNGIVNGATLTTDRFGNPNSAYDFDGINDYIEVLHNSSINLGTDSFTISAWCLPQQYNNVTREVINKSRRYAPDGYQFKLAMDGSNNAGDKKFFFAMGAFGNGTNWNSTYGHFVRWDSTVQLNSWYQLVIVRENKWFRFYVDGIVQKVDSAIQGITVDHSNNLNNYVIGALNDSTQVSGKFSHFKGKIDDIGIWKRALTPWEIKNLYCPSDSSSVSVTVCDSFVSPSGNFVWDSTGVYTDTLVNKTGCDSVIHITLTIHQTPIIWLGWNEVRCDPGHLDLLAYSNIGILNWYDSLTGIQVLDTGNNFHTPFLDSSRQFWVEAINQGCNSQRIPVSAGVIYSDSVFIDTSVCDQYIAPDSTVLNTSGIHIVKLKNSTGCDSVISISLSVITIDTGISKSNVYYPLDSMWSEESNADHYQWVFLSNNPCNDTGIILIGDTNQVLRPQQHGFYKVIIFKEGCVDTSGCLFYYVSGIEDFRKALISISPIPAKDQLHVEISNLTSNVDYEIFNSNGAILQRGILTQGRNQISIEPLNNGVYFIRIKGIGIKPFIKN